MWLLFWASAALAEGNLAWSWASAGSVSYHLEALVNTPRARRWYAEDNRMARATRQMVVMDTTCVGEPQGKRVNVVCTMDSVEFRGAAVAGEEAVLAEIMEADAARLQGRTLTLDVHQDGRILAIDLDSSIPIQTSQAGHVMDGLRQMISRALAPLDVQLPKDGVDKGKAWKQKGTPLSMTLMTDQGTAGSVVMKHNVSRTNDGTVRLTSTAKGTLSEGATMEQGTSTMLHVTGKGRAQFNTAKGVMDWSEVEAKVEYAAANLEGTSDPERSSFSAWAARIEADGTRVEPTE